MLFNLAATVDDSENRHRFFLGIDEIKEHIVVDRKNMKIAVAPGTFRVSWMALWENIQRIDGVFKSGKLLSGIQRRL